MKKSLLDVGMRMILLNYVAYWVDKRKEYWLFDRSIILVKRKIRRLLRKLYRFKPWHDDPLNAKPYAIYVLKNIPQLVANRNGLFVEIGCGLGDIIGNLDVEGDKYGFDTSIEAVRCAKLLHPLTNFRVGSFDNVDLSDIELLILMNFMHTINDDRIKESINSLLMKNTVHMICFDTFLKESADYPYVHKGEDIFGSDYRCIKRSKGFAGAGRNRRYIEFWRKCE